MLSQMRHSFSNEQVMSSVIDSNMLSVVRIKVPSAKKGKGRVNMKNKIMRPEVVKSRA